MVAKNDPLSVSQAERIREREAEGDGEAEIEGVCCALRKPTFIFRDVKQCSNTACFSPKQKRLKISLKKKSDGSLVLSRYPKMPLDDARA